MPSNGYKIGMIAAIAIGSPCAGLCVYFLVRYIQKRNKDSSDPENEQPSIDEDPSPADNQFSNINVTRTVTVDSGPIDQSAPMGNRTLCEGPTQFKRVHTDGDQFGDTTAQKPGDTANAGPSNNSTAGRFTIIPVNESDDSPTTTEPKPLQRRPAVSKRPSLTPSVPYQAKDSDNNDNNDSVAAPVTETQESAPGTEIRLPEELMAGLRTFTLYPPQLPAGEGSDAPQNLRSLELGDGPTHRDRHPVMNFRFPPRYE